MIDLGVERDGVPGQPDIVVSVGGREFIASSHFLCSYSEYFRAAYSGGSEEAQTGRFDFPERDSDEWEMIVSLLNPFSGVRVSLQNLDSVHEWFEFLGVLQGLKQCDNVLAQENTRDLNTKLRYLEKSLKYRLARSKSKYIEELKPFLTIQSHLMHESKFETILGLVLNYEDCREAWWSSLEQYLPKPVCDLHEQNVLIRTGVMEKLILDLRARKLAPNTASFSFPQASSWDHQRPPGTYATRSSYY